MKRFCFIFIIVSIMLISTMAQAAMSNWDDIFDRKRYEQEFSSIYKKAAILLIEAKYDELEALASEYRNSKKRCVTGQWVLAELYDSLSNHLREGDEKQFQTRLKRLNDWVAAKPDSITAKVALADCMISYAFCGRGDGYADTVTEDRWNIFYTRLKAAEEILIEAKKLEQKCPGWWAAYLRIALTAWHDRSRYEQLFKDAITFEPKYYTFYYYKAWALMPRWQGHEGELEQFSKTTADMFGGEEGDMLYAGIIFYLDAFGPLENRKNTNPNISWDRVAKGIKLLNERSVKLTTQDNSGPQPSGS